MEDGAYTSLYTEKAYPLDITDWHEKGQELSKAIELAVKDTQRVVVRALPDRLIMTPAQYSDLSKNPDMLQAYNESGTTDGMQSYFLYRVVDKGRIICLMEVEIKE